MLPNRVSNPGPLTYESGTLPTALPGPARLYGKHQASITLILKYQADITANVQFIPEYVLNPISYWLDVNSVF